MKVSCLWPKVVPGFLGGALALLALLIMGPSSALAAPVAQGEDCSSAWTEGSSISTGGDRSTWVAVAVPLGGGGRLCSWVDNGVTANTVRGWRGISGHNCNGDLTCSTKPVASAQLARSEKDLLIQAGQNISSSHPNGTLSDLRIQTSISAADPHFEVVVTDKTEVNDCCC